MSDGLATRLRALPGRYVHTGLTPYPIDTWAVAQWNTANRQAREHYHQLIATQGPGYARHPCTQCGKTRTTHPSMICGDCRRLTIRRDTIPTCTVCQKTRTKHDTGICGYCRKHARHLANAAIWGTCTREGCGRATRNHAPVCAACLSYKPPKGPGHHWSRRYLPTTP